MDKEADTTTETITEKGGPGPEIEGQEAETTQKNILQILVTETGTAQTATTGTSQEDKSATNALPQEEQTKAKSTSAAAKEPLPKEETTEAPPEETTSKETITEEAAEETTLETEEIIEEMIEEMIEEIIEGMIEETIEGMIGEMIEEEMIGEGKIMVDKEEKDLKQVKATGPVVSVKISTLKAEINVIGAMKIKMMYAKKYIEGPEVILKILEEEAEITDLIGKVLKMALIDHKCLSKKKETGNVLSVITSTFNGVTSVIVAKILEIHHKCEVRVQKS